MAVELTEEANKQSTYIVPAVFRDEDEALVVPNVGTVKWTLTNDTGGTVINSRIQVAETSASTVNIVLSGDDLDFDEDVDKIRRLCTVWAEYDSSLGNDLPLKEAFYFNIVDLKRIT